MNPRKRAFPRGWLLCLLAIAMMSGIFRWNQLRASKKLAPPIGSKEFLAQALVLEQEEEAEAGRKYWPRELEAERYGTLLDDLWDRINVSTNKLEELKKLPLSSIQLPHFNPGIQLPHGILNYTPKQSVEYLQHLSWISVIDEMAKAGWALEQCELRQIRFGNQSSNTVSTYYISGHLKNEAQHERAILEGNIEIRWKSSLTPTIDTIDASKVEMRTGKGPTPFQLVFEDEVAPPLGSYFIDPLIVRDLDHDGIPEIILAAKNRLYRRSASGSWKPEILRQDDSRLIFSAILEDFNGDGIPDLLCAKFEGLVLYPGEKDGTFPSNGIIAWEAHPHLKYAQVLSCGDLNGDGHLDIFLGQYKVPYDQGQIPAPYFDAKDGYPSYLLINDGTGHFSIPSGPSGLGRKQFRRIYSASLVDFDGDGKLDLITVSDFGGIDGFRNDSHGHFKDVTAEWFKEPHALGMAHSFADFNDDGNLDVVMIGMDSPVADRLKASAESRPYDSIDHGMREALTFGNRLFYGIGNGFSEQNETGNSVARTGWSWGSVAADFDNDGFPDLYIANGHESKASTRDYETEFWLHDIYMRPAKENPLSKAYFQEKFKRTRGNGWSYGGYEKNRFFLNLGGTNFVEVGYLFGVALEADSRNVAAEDLNGDGRLDLIVTTFEAYPRTRQTIKVFENQIEETGNWIEVEGLKPGDYGHLFTANSKRTSAHTLVTGDSYRTQHSPTIHIGLGNETNVTVRKVPSGEVITRSGKLHEKISFPVERQSSRKK